MSFSSDVARFCKVEAPEYVDKVIRKTVIEIGARVVLRSPVGDATYWQSPPPPGYVGGRFRSNWMYRFGSPDQSVSDSVDQSGSGSVQRITSGALSSSAIGVHYISNNLPYADRLENGWSRQAPTGIVSLVELEFEEIFRKAL